MTDEFQTYDADDVADEQTHEDYRSLRKISPTNEAAACQTLADCRALIDAELDRENPRRWVIGLFNDRLQDLRGKDD